MVIKVNCHTVVCECKGGGGKEEKERFFSMHVSLQLSGMRLQTHGTECGIPLPFPRADDLSEIKQIDSVSSEEAC